MCTYAEPRDTHDDSDLAAVLQLIWDSFCWCSGICRAWAAAGRAETCHIFIEICSGCDCADRQGEGERKEATEREREREGVKEEERGCESETDCFWQEGCLAPWHSGVLRLHSGAPTLHGSVTLSRTLISWSWNRFMDAPEQHHGMSWLRAYWHEWHLSFWVCPGLRDCDSTSCWSWRLMSC